MATDNNSKKIALRFTGFYSKTSQEEGALGLINNPCYQVVEDGAMRLCHNVPAGEPQEQIAALKATLEKAGWRLTSTKKYDGQMTQKGRFFERKFYYSK